MATRVNRPHFKTLIGSDTTARTQDEPDNKTRWHGHVAELMAPPPGGAAFVVDHELRYLVAEGDALHAAGLTPETLIGKTIFEALDPELAQEYEPHYRQALDGKSFSFEHEAHGRTYLSRGVPLRDPSGHIYAALVISYDITDRRTAETLQRRSEETFAALVENAPFGVYIVDCQFRLRAVNKGAEPVFRDVTPLLGRDFGEVVRILWPEPFASDVIDRFRHTMATGEPYLAPIFTESRQDAGRIESYHWQIQRLTLPDGTFAVVCYFHDLTDIRQAEAIVAATAERDRFLLELNDQLRQLAQPNEIMRAAAGALARQLNLAAAGYAEVDADGDTIHVGGGFSDGRLPDNNRHTYRISDFGDGFATVLQSGEDLFSEDIPADPRGPLGGSAATRAVQIRAGAATPLIKGGRLVAYMYGADIEPRSWTERDRRLFRDVAERTWAAVERARAETALRDSEARLRLALDASNMGTFVWHVQEDHGEPDARMLALFGLAPDATLNKPVALRAMISTDDRDRYAAAVQKASDPEGPGTLREDIRVRHPDGSTRWLAITARMIFEGFPRRAVRLVGMATDISERKFTEEALRSGEERLKEIDRRKDEFLAVLAHELRNPLAPIRTGLELIRVAGDTPGAVARVRAMMERQVNHMVRLIDDLLDVSRITSGKIRLQRQPTPLATLVNTAIDANRSTLTASGLGLTVDLPDTPVILDVDPTRFVQVVSNLLQNAIKFTDTTGRIHIAAMLAPDEGAEGTIYLTVSDTGVGISPELLPRVFDLFAQGDANSGRAHTGLGIGLALARRLVELHGGSIEAHSGGSGRGSAFTIRMPVSRSTAQPDLPDTPVQIPTIRRRVVVIDDNEDAANVMAALVTAMGGESRVAYDGESGLKQALEFRPDMVLLDIGMPGIDGYETCRRIRAALGSKVMIVALTGWGQEQDKQEARRAGFDAHLTKPADPALLERLLADIRPADETGTDDGTPASGS